ncbi:cytochrome P450 family protein [Lyngbya aestuarii BL J]|uniref:Cytochrome P450 family protein n=1 Tax=Lyngbya aestuarii BL J TaxID=1348334 RepID=U7QLW6_9CYAN|nr:cytochrome P450 [Lyngbya aestuarii]ERT07386.1 cytochrome P450 family protein [Lyngbya aestuarii BL J]
MTAIANQKAWTIPGPSPLPLVGRTVNTINFAKDSIGYSSELFKTYGKVASIVAGGGTNLYSAASDCPGSVIAYGPEIVRQVATQTHIYHKAPLSGTLYRYKDISERTKPLKNYGVGLFGVNDETHLQQRKLMMPAFHHQQLHSYRDDMVAITQSEIEQIKMNEPCEINQFMKRLTLRIATKSLFGEDVTQKDQSAGSLLQEILNIQISPFTKLLPLDLPGFSFHRYLNYLSLFETQMKGIIAEKKAKTTPDSDVLSMLIKARYEDTGHPLTEDELIAHTGVLFLAGHETTANALTWTLLLLSQHPQVCNDLLDELDSTLHGDSPSVKQLQQLPLLERVIKESLRVITSVPWNGRVTSQTTELGGYLLPKGTEVFVSIYHTHHLSDIYRDPEAFNPNRWENINPSVYEYNPFSAGPRLCLGAAFAMMEIKIVLAMLLQRFRWEYLPVQKIDRNGFIAIKPKFGMQMKVCPQDREFVRGVGCVEGNVREMVKLPS